LCQQPRPFVIPLSYSGGVYVQKFNAHEGEKMPSLDALLQWMMPNHSEITNKKEIYGFFTDTYFLNLERSKLAASGDTTTTNWSYIIFIDKNKSTDTKFVAYELFFNNNFVPEADAIKIAGTFKLL
jgi:hypothetical protein